ncbi:MAG TPA: energy transducer TonB [Candidatus Sulfotelmatobacter sp.]|nr:energy transducer TonB [Candidatus Sulfotelmatobacter sp.]
MIETLQLEEVAPAIAHVAHDAPKLLVEWSSRWEEFRGSIKPALSRSEARLAGEAPFGLVPFRIIIPSYVLEAFLILAMIFVKVKVDELRPRVVPRFSPHDVIYYSGDELPRTQDLGGAQAGATGSAGGDEAYHRTQTIKIARGSSLASKVVDAPNLKLPSSNFAVANLLAIQPNPGPPPTEGMRAVRSAPRLATIVAPTPDVIRDYTRNSVQLNSVVAPAPAVTRDRTVAVPSLNATLIAPPPPVSDDHRLIAPRMTPAVIPPAPRVTRDRAPVAPSLDASVVAAAPNVSNDRLRSSQILAPDVVPAAPTAVNRDISSAPVRLTDTNVVPPPVSAPEHASARTARLNMPAPAVVAPPPTANVSADLRRIPTGSAPDPTQAVVPPPPTTANSGSFMGSLIGKIFGPSEVVPPPPAVSAGGSSTASHSLGAAVLPPPPAVNSNAAAAASNANRRRLGSLTPDVVAPPASVGNSAAGSTRVARVSLGAPSVVPPPPSVSGSQHSGGALLASNVLPPPPSATGGANPSGMGRKGVGLGAPLNSGSPTAPVTNGGSGGSGAVMSTQPGPEVALPASGGTGSLALSPGGGEKAGLGGSGAGTGIGTGKGPGSGMNGAATGAGKSGGARGSDPSARGGISTTAGPGGAGNAGTGNPPVRGVDISGGTGIVNLPSFGSDPAGSSDPKQPSRSRFKHGQEIGVTVVATASSGGAFEPYKNLLRGEKYTTYLDTSLGTVVMEFADEKSGDHAFGSALAAPAPIRTDLSEGLTRARMVVTCTLDPAGNLSNVRVLEPGPATMTAKVVASLRSWKFQPAMRNNQPVAVTAILGFGIDTNDRF